MSSEFQVRVHVIEVRELVGIDRSGTSDPIVFVDVHGEKQHTDVETKTNSAAFDHLMFFSFSSMNEAQFMAGKIRLSVFDANTVVRDQLIGAFFFVRAALMCLTDVFARRWLFAQAPSIWTSSSCVNRCVRDSQAATKNQKKNTAHLRLFVYAARRDRWCAGDGNARRSLATKCFVAVSRCRTRQASARACKAMCV